VARGVAWPGRGACGAWWVVAWLMAALHGAAGAEWVAEAPGVRSMAVQPSPAGRTGFTLIQPEASGVTFTNLLAQARQLTNQILLNGSGVAAGDVDGDGWPDLFFAGLDGPNRLYRNRGGFRFEDITDAAGVAAPELDATGVLMVDLDGDGDLDLAVNSIGGGARFFFNDGKARFAELPANLVDGLAVEHSRP